MRRFYRILSVILAIVLATISPMQAFAAGSSTKYISEIVTVAAKSEKDAQTQLEAAGYKLVANSNLNATLKTGVYLGYKETDNKKEAITDIAAMNMLGKFSYSDYEQIMEAYRENIEAEVMGIETSIEEFQLSYANEKKNALMAYNALNLFKDDDSGKLMGDYFLDYDFSQAAKQSMTDTLMQANSDVVVSMIRALTFAGDADDTTVIDRMAKTGPDGIEERYSKTYQTLAQANRAMAKAYGTVADKLYDQWDAFYAYLQNAEKTVVEKAANGNLDIKEGALEAGEETLDTDGLTDEAKEFVEAVDAFSNVPENFETMTEFSLYALLSDTGFGTGTLLDFFMRPKDEVDRAELYVLVDSMTDAQKEQADFVDIKDILLGAFSDSAEADDEVSEAVEQYADFTEAIAPVSIFDGIDRSVFTDGVAFTSDAVAHEELTGQSWLDKLSSGEYWNTTAIACWAASAGLTVIGTVSALAWRALTIKAAPAIKKLSSALDMLSHKTPVAYLDVSEAPQMLQYLRENNPDAAAVFERVMGNAYKYNTSKMLAKIATVASFVLLVVILAYDIYSIVDFLMSDKPVEENIPHHLMATADTAYGEDYVYYQTVKTLDGDAADVNNHEADTKTGWLVLYTTKDANAGDPICVNDIKVVVGSTDFDEDASFAHLFNEVGALNTTSAIYTGTNDSINGTYILFSTDASAYTASAISGGNAALLAVGGLLLGGVLGSHITTQLKKKKKEPQPA